MLPIDVIIVLSSLSGYYNQGTNMNERVSIGQVKRDISTLINRGAYGSERIVLTSRGKPKAALVSMEDYQKLQAQDTDGQERFLSWMQQARALASQVLERRAGEMVDVETILLASQEDWGEARWLNPPYMIATIWLWLRWRAANSGPQIAACITPATCQFRLGSLG
jgi:prevent-host-death family protein